MTLVRAFIAVTACTAASALAGVGLGSALGHFAPGFYRATVPGGHRPEFDPVQVGVGFGLNAGVFTGVVVGLTLVMIVAYFELRTVEIGRRSRWPTDQRPTLPAREQAEQIRRADRPEM